MRGYDPDNELVIIANDPRPDKGDEYKPNLNPSPREIAAQGFETIVSAAPAAPYSKERDTTYQTDDGFMYPSIPWRY